MTEDTKKTAARLCTQTALVSGIFSCIVAALLLINYLQFSEVKPLEYSHLQDLIQSNIQNPGHEIKTRIRDLDLLERRAFFSSRRYAAHGGILLGIGIILLLSSLAVRNRLSPSRPESFHKPENPVHQWLLPVWFALCVGIISAVTGFFFSARPAERKKPVITFALSDYTASWPCFRGPGNLGIAKGTYPVKWNETHNVKWSVAVPLKGYSSPVIWSNRVYITGSDDKTDENECARSVFCYDLATGELIWEKNIAFIKNPVAQPGEYTGYASSTPAVYINIYAVFGTGELVCLDPGGNVVWRTQTDPLDTAYGYSSSLLIFSNMLYAQYDQENSAVITAYRIHDGTAVWKTKRPVMPGWSSPSIIYEEGKEMLVINGNPFVAAYNPFTGTELWRAPEMEGEVAPSAAVSGGLLFAVNEFGRLMALEPESGTRKWEAFDDLPDVASPAGSDGLLVTASSAGYIVCYDALTGSRLWEHVGDESFYSSPIITEDAVYATDRSGTTFVFSASRTKKLLSVNPLPGSISATAAFCKGNIVIRTDRALYCIAVK